jgi:cytochrome c556
LKKILAMSLLLISVSATAGEIDTRRSLPMNEMQRDHILTEMRALLAGAQGILSALTRDDMASVADHARPLGTGMPHKGEDHMKAILPQEFMQMGMSLHRDFDQIAADAESMKDPKHTLKQLSDSMGKCVSCHASYQIRVTGPSTRSQSKTIRHNH